MTTNEKDYARQLLSRYVAGECTPEERVTVNAWFNQQAEEAPSIQQPNDMEEIGHSIWSTLPPAQRNIKLKLWRKVAAAAALVIILFNVFKVTQNNPRHNEQIAHGKKTNIVPGDYGATLLLANGKQIKLSQLKNGILAKEAGISVIKTGKGEVVYQISDKIISKGRTNTLSTSKGETFKVKLPDGSSVWLNAASSLTYPTDLGSADIRQVKLTGEAYFEVAHDHKHPFIIDTQRQEIKVLGTEFNVSAYPDDTQEITSLIRGKVSVHTANKGMILLPGEKSIVNDQDINKRYTNIDSEISWKNNEFLFDSQDIYGIMKILSRWYNIDVIYKGEIPKDKISGSITRFAEIHDALNLIESTGAVKINITGSTVTISARNR